MPASCLNFDLSRFARPAMRRATAIALAITWILCWTAFLQAEPGSVVAYPRDYRTWVHVKSGLIGPDNPIYARYGGLHHIYANELAMQGYRTGQFPDGSVIVFDLLETREKSGATAEGPRRFIDVMTRDSRQFADTAGWGFEEFKGDSQTDRVLSAEARAACYTCHTTVKGHDFVFSAFRK